MSPCQLKAKKSPDRARERIGQASGSGAGLGAWAIARRDSASSQPGVATRVAKGEVGMKKEEQVDPQMNADLRRWGVERPPGFGVRQSSGALWGVVSTIGPENRQRAAAFQESWQSGSIPRWVSGNGSKVIIHSLFISAEFQYETKPMICNRGQREISICFLPNFNFPSTHAPF